MSNLTLGLDLGSNSIGWALVDEVNDRLIAAGVRVFPEGVDRDQKGGEKSKNEDRRIARGMRRQIARRSRRKRQLRACLRRSGLLPADPAEDRNIDALDPYELRARALHSPLQPFELGRVLIHLNQRRGFLSNRKTDRARKNEASKMLKEISALAGEIESAGHQTLGEHLADMNSRRPLVRLRGRHTRRDMLEREFELIWNEQKKHHPSLLTDELRQVLNDQHEDENWVKKGLIFGQRKMYWPKSVVGACELEPKKKRCPRADRSAQRFRLLQEVNNLRLLDSTTGLERALSPEERANLIKALEKKKEMSFDDIRKKLNLLEHVRFNFERAERKKLDGMPTDTALAHKSCFGKAWFDRSAAERNAIVRSLLEDEESAIRAKATAEWGLPPERVDDLLGAPLADGYASLSRDAIEKLLPYLERGLPLMTRDSTPCALREAGYLRPDQRVVQQRELLPAPPEVTNPLVRQALHEVRKVVNAIIREYGKPAHIHIELAREVKGTLADRQRLTRENAERRKARDQAAEEIRTMGFKVSKDAIDRYLLWSEQKSICIYSGRPISQSQLFGGEVHVDHILPRHRSLDNSMMNRVVCFRDENDRKRDRTPHEWLAAADPARYEAVLQRAGCLPYPKLKKFRQQEIKLDDFVSRQLTDTAYISRKVLEYVECLGCDVVCTKGQLTADLRHHWGLDSVLRNDDLKIKNRDDHRHHAVDAIAIALMNRSRLQQLSRLYQPRGMPSDALPLPWATFREDVEKTVNAIYVSHRVRRKVCGALHEETIYGPTAKPNMRSDTSTPRGWAKNWVEDPKRFVYRKPLEALTLSMIDDIRDETIRNIVIKRLNEFGVKPGEKKKIPAETWKKPLLMPSGVPIKKVRLLKSDETIRPIRNGASFIKPGSIHHLCLYEVKNPQAKVKREALFVSMLDAADRVRTREPVIQRTHPDRAEAKFLMSLSMNELVMLKHDGKQDLYRFVTAASTSKQMWFQHHTAAGKSTDKIGILSKRPDTFHGHKVVVDVLGRIRNSND